MELKPPVSGEKLMQAVAFGNTEADVLASFAGLFERMEQRIVETPNSGACKGNKLSKWM